MREFAQKQNKTQKANSTAFARLWEVTPAKKHDVNHGLSTTAGVALGHDFSRIPVHAQTPMTIQPKLIISTPGNIHEQEADRVAQQVISMRDSPLESACTCGGGCPKCQNEQDTHRPLQTKRVQVNDSVRTAVPPIIYDELDSSGLPMDPATRGFMESRFSHDFSQVRVHRDEVAAESASTIGALAYTSGHHIVFGQGQYEPMTESGQRLLAHELTHVLQQTTGSHMVVQRQTDKTKKGKRRKADAFVVKEGKIEKRLLDFNFEYVDIGDGERAGFVDVNIELSYTRESSSKYADPSKVNWFQTFQTNYITNSNEVPSKETEMEEYVDGCSGNEVCLCDKGTSVFEDTLHRRSLTDRDVYWKAQTSVVGILDDGMEILGTVEWGFQMNREGNPHYIQLRQVKTPSSFHLEKFQELQSQEKGEKASPESSKEEE